MNENNYLLVLLDYFVVIRHTIWTVIPHQSKEIIVYCLGNLDSY